MTWNESQRVNYHHIISPRTIDQRLEALDAEIKRVDYVCLTDAISHMGQGGEMMFEALAEDHRQKVNTGKQRTFKIRVLRDQWGNEPSPGDVVKVKRQKPYRDRAGRKLRSRAINDMKRRGTFDKAFIEIAEYVIDTDGCITCNFEDGGHLLLEFGVHFESREALCGRRELSSGPCKVLDENGRGMQAEDDEGKPRYDEAGAPVPLMKHVWYWRYEEAPPWTLDAAQPTSPTSEGDSGGGYEE